MDTRHDTTRNWIREEQLFPLASNIGVFSQWFRQEGRGDVHMLPQIVVTQSFMNHGGNLIMFKLHRFRVVKRSVGQGSVM